MLETIPISINPPGRCVHAIEYLQHLLPTKLLSRPDVYILFNFLFNCEKFILNIIISLSLRFKN